MAVLTLAVSQLLMVLAEKAGIVELAHQGLSELAKLHPIFERWIIFLGFTYMIMVLAFPTGIAGAIATWKEKRKSSSKQKGVLSKQIES
ncbi:hypothetical protein EEL32_21350 [Brevibacillus laterosporus]|nr:hypothetical protein [Brevibacillus laterosporus]TPG79970.1 hypothetical protein EEL32_21350 [Brevibacillus laterosporus]